MAKKPSPQPSTKVGSRSRRKSGARGSESFASRSGKKVTEDASRRKQKRPPIAPLIVGIGASAGGFEAFNQILRALPGDTGMALVLVQHLDPLHESKLTELLQRVTKTLVKEITHRMAVEPNTIYVIPPNHDVTI